MHEILPESQRPICLNCGKELLPNFHPRQMPFGLARNLQKQWRKDHPLVFDGTYGKYRDNLFCTLGCGYAWAVQHSVSTKEVAP